MKITNQGRFLRLRQTIPSDTPLLVKFYQNKEFSRLYRSNDKPIIESKLYSLLSHRQQQTLNEIDSIEFLIEHKTHGPIGLAVLGDYSFVHRRAEFLLGIVDKKFRNAFYGVEALLLALDLAFNDYNLNKVYGYHYEYNEDAHKMVVKIGYREEGFLYHHHFSTRDKCFVSLYLDGITCADFRENKKIERLSKRLLHRDITKTALVIDLNDKKSIQIPKDKENILKMLFKKNLQ